MRHKNRAMQLSKSIGRPLCVRRLSSDSSSVSRRDLERLEAAANASPHDARAQTALLRALNQYASGDGGNARLVLHRAQSGRFAMDEEGFKEYVKALSATGKLGSTPPELLVRPLSPVFAAAVTPPYYASPSSTPFQFQGNFGSSSSADGFNNARFAVPASAQGVGPFSEDNPIAVKIVEGNFRSSFFRGLKNTFAFLPLGLGALLLFSYLTNNGNSDGKGAGAGGMDFGRLMLGSKERTPVEKPNKTFNDVKGADEAKEELQEIVAFLRDPSKFHRLGGKISKGILLTGPPGNGKTLLAKAVAGEAGVPFFYASASEFEEMFVGVGARRVRDLFNTAKKHQPCIIFIDELDAVGGKRELRDSQFSKMTLNQLLVELDGFVENEGIVVIGATNLPGVLDKALIRPGRFDRTVFVPLPDIKGRRSILALYASKIPLDKDVNLDIIARATAGLSGAELANIINTAAVRASAMGKNVVSMNDLVQAKDKVIMGPERKSAVIPEEVRLNTAIHESGHTLVALYTPGAKELHQVTIIPRGPALGMNQFLESEINMNQYSRKNLMAMIDVCMGGTAAEELVFGPESITTGASNDLEQATNLAHSFVTTFGMGELGKFSASSATQISPEMQHSIDEEKKKILNESYKRVKKLLSTHSSKLHTLSEALLEKETLSKEEVLKILEIS